MSLLEISDPSKLALFVLCLIAATGGAILVPDSTGLAPAARRALFILLFAGTLWLTDAVPAFAVGILIIGLQIALLGRPGGVFATSDKDWEQFVTVLGHPLVWLFFGGFVLAAGMSRAKLDRRIASILLPRFGSDPASLLKGLMLIAFVLSMFMSNTATTAMLVAMMGPLLAARPARDRISVGLLLGVATAANLGGMASLIGTPPNAVAVGNLAELPNGPEVSFLQWMLVGFPLAACLVVVGYLYIKRRYLHSGQQDSASSPEFQMESLLRTPDDGENDQPGIAVWQQLIVFLTVILTVGLWMTGQWHGLPTAVVSFIPIVLLTISGVLKSKDMRSLPYDVLFLLAGGLALGQTMSMTGLSDWIVRQIPAESLASASLILIFGYATVLLSNFMSNTAASNVVIPLGIVMAAGFEAQIAIPIAFSASAAMCLPVATPPNAMVYGTGRVNTKDFLVIGLIFGLITPLLSWLWTGLVLESVLGLA
jgi:sodium-dependent dicarboxylate transporter 2/3/5